MPRQDTRNPFPLVEGNPEATQHLIRNEHHVYRNRDEGAARTLRVAIKRQSHSPAEESTAQTSPELTLLGNALLHRLRSGLNQGWAQAEQSVPPSGLVHRSSCP
jgi:hypothetical protein